MYIVVINTEFGKLTYGFDTEKDVASFMKAMIDKGYDAIRTTEKVEINVTKKSMSSKKSVRQKRRPKPSKSGKRSKGRSNLRK